MKLYDMGFGIFILVFAAVFFGNMASIGLIYHAEDVAYPPRRHHSNEIRMPKPRPFPHPYGEMYATEPKQHQ